MPRSLWTGSLSFGLVNVPVAMFSGVSDRDLHARQLHAKDHTIELPDEEDDEPTPVPDLMAALERSLEEAKA